jgi:hypothetical protein
MNTRFPESQPNTRPALDREDYLFSGLKADVTDRFASIRDYAVIGDRARSP